MAPPQVLADDEELVAGRRPVEEAFVARRPARRLLVVPQRRAALEKLVLHATNLRIPIVEVEGGSLTALAGFDGHQGIALVVEPRRFAGLDDILALAATRGEPPFILVLDSLEDPHNVGSLLRSAEGAGVHGVIFPTHRQAPLSPSAVKASAGAVEHLLLCPVDDLAGALSDLHVRGVRIAGAEGDAPMTARQSDLRGPLAIVVGSEGQGLGPAVRRRCDLFMRIPMRGAVGSLNAAVAGSILLFEAVAQRDDPAGTAGSTSEDAGAAAGDTTQATVTGPEPGPAFEAPPFEAAPNELASVETAATETPPTDDAKPATGETPPPAREAKPQRRSRAKAAPAAAASAEPAEAPKVAEAAEVAGSAEASAPADSDPATRNARPKTTRTRATTASPESDDAPPPPKSSRAKGETATPSPRPTRTARPKRTAATAPEPADEPDDQDDGLLPT